MCALTRFGGFGRRSDPREPGLKLGTGKIFHWEPLGNSFDNWQKARFSEKYFPENYEQEWGCEEDEPQGGACTFKECFKATDSARGCKMGRVYVSDAPEGCFTVRALHPPTDAIAEACVPTVRFLGAR